MIISIKDKLFTLGAALMTAVCRVSGRCGLPLTRSRYRTYVCMAALIVSAADSLTAATYYIATYGSDSNSGTTTNAAWRNISKANSTLVAGDRVEIRAGIYDDLIQPANSGISENARIIYTSYNGETVFVRGKAATQNGTTVNVKNRNYITVLNLDLSGDKYNDFNKSAIVAADGSQHFSLLNCNLTRANYLSDPRLVDGLSSAVGAVRTQDQKDGVSVGTAQFALIENCTIVGWRSAVGTGLSIRTTLRNNVIQNNWHTAIDAGNYVDSNPDPNIVETPPIDMFLLIEGNNIGGSMISDAFQTGTSDPNSVVCLKIVFRNNYFYYNGEDHLDFKGGGQILVEGNVFAGASGDNDGYAFNSGREPSDTSWRTVERFSGAITRGAATVSSGVIIRKNVFYDNSKGVGFAGPNWKCYNNTFAANNRDFSQGWNSTFDGNSAVGCHFAAGALDVAGGDFINNISIDHMLREIERKKSTVSMILDNNLYNNTIPPNGSWRGGLRFVAYEQNAATNPNGRNYPWSVLTQFNTIVAWRTYLNANAPNVIGREANSKVGDPQFVNVPAYPNLYFNFKRAAGGTVPTYPPVITIADRATWFPYDFHLQSNSSAINAGRTLTIATGVGSNSTTLLVADANFFCDGFGISGVSGDQVQVGNYSPARIATITAIDYINKILTLATPLTWANNDAVSLPYNGTAPDIGAFEYIGGESPPPTVPAAPSNLTATLISSNQINLTWTDNSTNETQFRIERKIGGGSYNLLSNVVAIVGSGGTGNFSDVNLTEGMTYTYQVRADGSNGTNSAWSNSAITNTPSSGGGWVTNLYEAELLPITGVPLDTALNFAEGGASGGTNSLLQSTNIGNFITYTVNVPATGTYNLRVRVDKLKSRGICNLYVDNSATAQGGPMDLFFNDTTVHAYEEVDVGNVTFTNASTHTLKFQVSGKNASSTGYKLSFDYIKLIGNIPALLLPPVITGAASSSSNFVLTFSTEAGGLYEVQRTEDLISPVWVTVVTNIPGTGGNIQIIDTNMLNRPKTFYRVRTGM